MKNLQFIPLGVCIFFISGTFSDDPTMLETIITECNFSKVYKTSQIDIFRNEPEFKECKNLTAITSIKSVEQFTEDNKGNIRCLLYYESLVSMCKNVSALDRLYDLLIATPKNEYVQDFCENLLSFMGQLKLPTIHSLLKNSKQCEYLCSDYQNGELALKTICVKSYNLIKYSIGVKNPVGGNTNNNELRSEKRLTGDTLGEDTHMSENGGKVKTIDNANTVLEPSKGTQGDTVPVENLSAGKPETIGVSHDISNQQDALKKLDEKVSTEINQSAIQSEGVATSVDAIQKKGSLGDILSKTQGEILTKNFKPKGDELAPPSSSSVLNLNSKSSTAANDELVKEQLEQDGQEDKRKIDTNVDSIDAVNDQQVEDQNTAAGKDYDMEQEKPEQNNEPKQVDTMVEADPDDAVPDSYKMPKVSQLSDRFNYNADVNGNSSFFAYFSFTCVIFVIGYVIYHNKTKVLALLVEGRHSRRTQRVRRPNIANYQKLDCNLEEAISSSVNKNTSHIIY